ncbi:uncharacterized protein VTP21DRAFT_2511 [Calcarisporiella thermophila]|uniref:uncharacterized protein n=1 Tax=Calcarisporiella thermophila TaxID=911321 RepID=UPI003742E6A8
MTQISSPLSSGHFNQKKAPTATKFISSRSFIAPSASESSGIKLYSPAYFELCAIGGMLACGPTHTLVTPLDLVKCRRQVNASLYKGNFDGWAKIYRAEGLRGVFTGWGPTAIGYSLQGAFKYGFYELFKHQYSELVGAEYAHKYRDLVYIAASASAEFFADIALAPWEALKVRMQTSVPPFAATTREGFVKLKNAEGLNGFYKGLAPLWTRQIPYTVVKFLTFERAVETIYSFLPKEKQEYNSLQQLSVSFAGGYFAGVLCAVISHPADVVVSKLNNAKSVEGESTAAAILRISRQLGFKGMWTGLGTRIIMIGTLTGLQWLFYDTFKVQVGLPTTGGH